MGYGIKGTVRMVRKIEIDTEHDDYGDQVDALTKMAKKLAPSDGWDVSVSVESVVALSGRAIARVHWYDLHGPGDIIVVTAAKGHAATAERLDGVAERLATMGIREVDRWNVGSCGWMGHGASIRVKGRATNEPFSPEEESFLRGGEMIVADECHQTGSTK